MAKLARDSVEQKKLTALADRDYFAGEEILQCKQAGISALVPDETPSTIDFGAAVTASFSQR